MYTVWVENSLHREKKEMIYSTPSIANGETIESSISGISEDLHNAYQGN